MAVETDVERLERFRGYARQNRWYAEALAAAGFADAVASYRDSATRYAALCQRWKREANGDGAGLSQGATPVE